MSHTIKGGWRKTGLAPFCPEQVIAPLRAQEAARAAEYAEEDDNLERPTTPTIESSEGEGEGIPAVLRGLSPPTHGHLLHQLLSAMGTPLFEELSRPFQTPQPNLLPGGIGWSTPKTIRTLNLQEKAVAFTLRKSLPREQAEDVISTLKGSSAMARNAAGLEQALHRTKAAEHARAERRRRNRRVVDVGGGPVYAGDCRRMATERAVNEAAKQEAAVAARQRRALVKRFNTWKRILSNVRNWGKKSSKRHLEGTLLTRVKSNMTIFDGPVLETPAEQLTRWEYRVT
ncbi:hypothetical protein DM02DRAFT_578018, partial [Periconia macrospinosa]